MVGGELARTIGPLVAVQAVVSFSLAGLWRVIPIAVLASVILWWRLSRIPVAQRLGPEQDTPSIFADVFSLWKRTWRIVVAVLGLMMARAFLAVALVIYLPTFIHSEGGSLWFANISLSVVQLAGAVGALTSGTLSDWFGRRRVLTTAVVFSPLFMFLFLMAEGVWILPVLMALGFFSLATTPVMMAVMIENAGADKATANGTFMTIAFGMRAFVVLLVGAMGDVLGLRDTFALCGVFAILAIPFVFMLPRDARD